MNRSSVNSPRKHALGRRAFLIGLAGAGTAATAAGLKPKRQEQQIGTLKLGSIIPASIGPWRYGSAQGVVVARDEDAVPPGLYDQLVARSYEAPGLPTIMLLVAYGAVQGGTLQLHRPETCYPGQGFELSNFMAPELALASGSTVPARRFTAIRDERVERLTYWTRVGNDFPRNTAGLYSAILESVLRGYVPDGVLVRLSTLSRDTQAADQAIDLFARQLLSSMDPSRRRLLVG